MSSGGIVCSQDRKAVHNKTCQKDSRSSSRSGTGTGDPGSLGIIRRAAMNCHIPCKLSYEISIKGMKELDSYRTFRWAYGVKVIAVLGQVPVDQKSPSFFSNHDISCTYITMKDSGILIRQTVGYSIISCQGPKQKANESLLPPSASRNTCTSSFALQND